MKKISLFFLFLLTIGHTAWAGDITKLLSDLAKNKQVKTMKATKEAGDEMLQKLGDTTNFWDSGVETIESMSLNDVPEKELAKYKKRIHSLKDEDGYQRMITIGMNGAEQINMIIMMKVENKVFTEFLCFVIADMPNMPSNFHVMKMSGQMNVDAMKKLGQITIFKDATLDADESDNDAE